jgi:NitT/TauT family transport system substrate-binding protein
MRAHSADGWSRRAFLAGLTLTGTAGLLGVYARSGAAEPPPETTEIRLVKIPGLCIAPQYVAEELLQGEGFTAVHYVETATGTGAAKAVASGEAHITLPSAT